MRGPKGETPIRTCVGCRALAPQPMLLRFATVDGVLVPDPSRRLPGRGAWLHPSTDCLKRAIERRAFQRALRSPAQIPSDTVDFITEWQRSASTS